MSERPLPIRGTRTVLPWWADEWLPGRCGCRGRLVRVIDMTGQGHTACAASGRSVEKCPDNQGGDHA